MRQMRAYRRVRGKMRLIGRATRSARPLASDVLPLSWRLVSAAPRPQVEIMHADARRWLA